MRTLGNALMLTAVALAVVCTSARAQAPAGRVGFIDVQRVLVRSAAGVAAREQLEREVDYYWTKLSEGGEEGPCGWLKDKYGLSWQVVPVGMNEMLNDPDQARGQRAMKAMLGMKKIDLAALHAAADQA